MLAQTVPSRPDTTSAVLAVSASGTTASCTSSPALRSCDDHRGGQPRERLGPHDEHLPHPRREQPDDPVGHPVPDHDVVGVTDPDDGGLAATASAVATAPDLAHDSPSSPATSAATSPGVRPAVSTRKVATRS